VAIVGVGQTKVHQGFWDGVKNRKLVFQRCKECSTWVHPQRPTCPKCRSLEKEWVPSSGKGAVHSWVVYRDAPHPGFIAPHVVVRVELEEGVRIISNVAEVELDGIYIGMPVEVVFENVTEELALPKFKKAG
jgi:uncharacterized protein